MWSSYCTPTESHCTEGVPDCVESRQCSCIDDICANAVRVRKVLSVNGASQGKLVSILANNVYFGDDGHQYKYTESYR